MAKKVLLTASTPLGHRVVMSRDRWREIIRFKHPVGGDDPQALFVITAYLTLKLKKGQELWTK